MKWRNLFDTLQFIFVIVFTLLVTGIFAPLGIDPHHDGIVLKPAIDILHGKVLFKESFTQYGALTVITQAGALRIFGEFLIVIKYLTVAFYVACAAVTWLLWRKFIPSLLATLSIGIWVGLMGFYDSMSFLPWSSVYALLCEMSALYLLVLWVEKKRNWLLAMIGILAALAFWYRQPAGIYIFGAVLLYFAITRFKKVEIPSLVPLFGGFCGIHLLFFLWLTKMDALSDWWMQSIGFAASWQRTVATQLYFPFFQISQLLPLSKSGISIWIIFPAVCVYQGYNLIQLKRYSRFQLQLLALICMCLFSWLQYYPVGEPIHALWAATPMIGVFMYASWNNSHRGYMRTVIFIFCLTLILPDLYYRLREAKHKLEAPYFKLKSESVLKGMKETKSRFIYFSSLVDIIKKYESLHPKTFVVTLTPDALYALLGRNTINCSRYYVDWRWEIFDRQISSEYTLSTNRCIAKEKPLIFTDKNHFNPTGYIRLPTTGISELGYLLAPHTPQPK